MLCEIKLEKFEGPLDLLLHLIKKNEMDIYDIPMAEITSQYLAAIDAMKSLNLDVASEFLVMAATLIHIKSRMLLPQTSEEETDDEEIDPRAELVRRLLEYQKYKAAAASLEVMPQLARDVFSRGFAPDELSEAGEESFVAVELYDLLQAFQGLLQQLPEETVHEVTAERLSVSERINQILSLLGERDSLAFAELFAVRPARHEVVVTFLATLELVKLRLIRIMQSSRFGSIWLFPADQESELKTVDEDALGYG